MRSETSLIQTIGRAARNAEGKVIMYADTITASMERAINETRRRRKKQDDYNKANGITPVTVKKEIRDILDITATDKKLRDGTKKKLSKKEAEGVIAKLTEKMKEAAKNLDFELAAALRDKIISINAETKK